MGKKLLNAPVYYALAQVHFNPIAAMDKYVNEIQDKLRNKGYTLFNPDQITQLQFAGGIDQGAYAPTLAEITEWLISKSDQTAGFILASSSITFHTTHYNTSAEFIPDLIAGLKSVHKVVNLDHISRLGLRYLDAIVPEDDETLEQYLSDALHGIQINATRDYALTESVFSTEYDARIDKGKLVARVYRATSPIRFPPDIRPRELILNDAFNFSEVQNHAIIDIDHYIKSQIPLDLERISEQLGLLHAGVREVYEATVTDRALNMWS